MRVFTVPPSAPFLRSVAIALIGGSLVDGFDIRANPERLADATIYLPTQRASRMTREIFLDVLGTDAAILPRMVALGDVDEDELDFSDLPLSGSGALDIPPGLDDLERRLSLAQLIGSWVAQLRPDDPAAAPLVAGGPASALALAGDLARLMDDMTTRGLNWSALDGLVPVELDQYWQLTLDFLKIAKQAWPAHLQEIGKIDPAARRDLLISAEAVRLKTSARGPVIAAGSTGSMPATARLLHVIADLPNGAVILPGLDTHLDESAWQSIGGTRDATGKSGTPPLSGHPQFALHGLLTRFGISRSDVTTIGESASHARDVLASEAMRPAEATSQWYNILRRPDVAQAITGGLQNLVLIEAANTENEALAIAVAMREAHEKKMSAAFVTPDRALARRVIAALGRWNLDFEDSAGLSLIETQAGLFARLAAIAEDCAPASLLALLKHPLLRLGGAKDQYKQAIADLELALLRGTRPASRCAGLARDFVLFRVELGKLQRKEASTLHRSEPRVAIPQDRLDAVGALIEILTRAMTPLEDIRKVTDFSRIAHAHREVLRALSADDTGEALCFSGADGRALNDAFDVLLRGGLSGLTVAAHDYADVFQTAFADRVVRHPPKPDTRLRIYGLLEARLIECDRVILGGLTEGVWPPQPKIDPWLNRPMRHQLGLNLPERRIGLTAHDFAQLLGHQDVILSRAAKVGGAPAVASRFLHRLEAVAGERQWHAVKEAGEKYIRYADSLDRPDRIEPAPQPMPRPALALRPLRLSVTEIEHWLRDPYSIYAKHILKLSPLDPVDMPLTAADRGSAIHDAIGDFTLQFAKDAPPDATGRLREIGAKHFAPLMERPEARALWWPRFQRIAAWFANWDGHRRADISRIDAEARGEIKIPLDHGRVFTLSARADRIEHRRDGTYAILDYKTGAPPSSPQVSQGLSPQLTLEAAILRGGGFTSIAEGASVSELVYVRLSGNRPAGKESILELKKADAPQTPDDAATEARLKLEALIREFEKEHQPYASLVLSMWSDRYGPYDNLARIKEWSASLGVEDIE
jgi:ATP-dependent helicase/nuclease subunit B